LRKTPLTSLVPPLGQFWFKKNATESLSNFDFAFFYVGALQQELISHWELQNLLIDSINSWQQIISMSCLEDCHEVLQDALNVENLLGVIAY
jgi:hypothetical protein